MSLSLRDARALCGIVCENCAVSRVFYTALLCLLIPLGLAKLLLRSLRQPEYLHHMAERFACYHRPRPAEPVLWLHCVSVGETHAAIPLVNALRQHYPGYRILLTHATPSGRATGEQLFGGAVERVYLPYDLPGMVARFLGHFRPRLGLILETEVWFNLIEACARHGIPLLLVNARLSEKSARGYARFGALVSQCLHRLTAVAAQTEADAARLRALGALRVAVTGNLKFDVTPPAEAAALGAQLRRLFGPTRAVFLAASTRDGEETLILDAVAAAKVPGLLTVIVPRHPQRFDEVARLLERRGLRYVRRSANLPAQAGVDVVLGDSMGEMFGYYGACDLAFIGGSLLPLGGQNLIEACVMGRPVLIGPHTFNFAEASMQAVACGAARRVQDVAELAAALRQLLADATARQAMAEAGLAFAAANRGATRRTLAIIEKYLQ